MEAKQKKQLDLLTAIEQIVEKAKDSKLSPEFYRKASRYIKYVSEKLDLTKEQSVMLALFIEFSCYEDNEVKDISRFLNCSTAKILRYTKEIEDLEKREILRCCREGKHITYRVPTDVIEAFKNDENYIPKRYKDITCAELFGVLEEIFEMRNDKELSYDAMSEKIELLFEDNKNLEYVKYIKSLHLDKDEEMLLVLFTHLFVNNHDNYIRYHDLEFLYDSKAHWSNVKWGLNAGYHRILRKKLVEYNNNNGIVDRESFRVSRKAKKELLCEISIPDDNQGYKEMIKHKEIVEKKLYYGSGIQNQIMELTSLLEDGHFQMVRTRMKSSGFRCGFTCLFYGGPGSGKTETVLQLARQTGRDIVQVNISQIKRSEKNIKALFDEYRDIVGRSEKTPILLFNEADAIINKRQEGAERAVDKMENSIQNIILQEMENLDGIMIATTNLAQNMDKAFERRFLYKIKFEKPTLEARMHIWHEMIPTLSEDDTMTLAEKYEFSGGQIENIARHILRQRAPRNKTNKENRILIISNMDARKVQEIFNSTVIKDIEIEILSTQHEVDRRHFEYEAGEEVIKCLLGTRKSLLNKMFVMDEDSKKLLSNFNEALKAQLLEMRKRALSIYASNVNSGLLPSFSLRGRCFLGYDYSKIHPVQTMRAKKMWAVLNGSLTDYMPLYMDGVNNFVLDYVAGRENDIPSENQLLYLDEKIDNWNDELDQEMTKDMHLIHPFHNLYSHMDFSIFDLLWVRDFNIGISLESDYDTYPKDTKDDDLDWSNYDFYD